MDLTKLSGSSFNESGLFGGEKQPEESSIERFLADTNERKLTSSVGDLLNATRSRHGRQYTESRYMSQSASMSMLQDTGMSGLPNSKMNKKGGKDKMNGSQREKAGNATDFNVNERPANRVDIAKLERELEVRVEAIVSEHVNMDDPSELADPRKDGMVIIRDKVLATFQADLERLQREPWLDTLIKCECVKITCDDIAKRLTDMLSVTSTELGNVLRKLRLAYMQTFEQMTISWQQLRSTFVEYESELLRNRETLSHLQDRLDGKDEGVRLEMQHEIERLTEEFNLERQMSADQLAESEFKIEQMSETLVSLNGIFKNMQNDGTTVRMSDLTAKCKRLERENNELESKGMMVDKLKNDLEVALERVATLEKENKSKDMEVTMLNQQLARREEAVVALMERESLRNAEIEKMKDITGVQDGEELDIVMPEPATSVLCIKCKKSLDDLSNIRAAVLNKSDKSKIQCENFRILLPNLRGRRPNRSTEWLRESMRSILVAKMREDITLLDLRGESSSFSSFVYAWFSRSTDYAEGGTEQKTQQLADEDRWGFYYGVKAMAKDNDPEATIFFTLLEENMGEDGMQFIFHCLSIALTLGGADLWKQFGSVLTAKSVAIHMQPEDRPSIRHNIWIDVGSAVEALKLILVRALKPHMTEAVDAIYAFRELPHVADPQVAEEKEKEKEKAKETETQSGASGAGGHEDDDAMAVEPAAEAKEKEKDKQKDGETEEKVGEDKGDDAGAEETKPEDDEEEEPTHINLFVWLRLLLQQMQAEQIHRGAAVRLMCESASVGALTPQLNTVSDPDDLGSRGSQVEYPQFVLIAKTLFPSISNIDTASLYIHCYDEGRRKVTAEVILKVADRKGLFSRSMRLCVMPLLRADIKEFDIKEAVRQMKIENGEVQENIVDGEEDDGAKDDNATSTEQNNNEEGKNVDSTPMQQEVASAEEMDAATVAATESVASVDSSAAPKASFKRAPVGPAELTPEQVATAERKANEQKLRSQLGVLIHRKVAAMMPDLELLMKRVPDRWRGLLSEAREGVVLSLNESYDKMRRVRMEGREELLKAGSKVDHYIDGIQPFVQYRRLLATMLMVKTLSENPLLPSELFLGQKGTVLPNFNFALRHVEDAIGALEKSIVTTIRLDCINTAHESTTRNLVATTRISEGLARYYYGDLGTSKVYRYEAARLNICARRLQHWCLQKFSSYSSAVPSAIRRAMSPGYLRRACEVGNVRDRRILRAPWWSQSLIAEIYSFKFEYDRTAVQLGQKQLPLGQAVVACCFKKFGGVTGVSDRIVHDLCYNVRIHMNTSSRMKLFSAFTGFENKPKANSEDSNGREALVEDVFGEADILKNLLKSNLAVHVYMNLICEIHREVATVAADQEVVVDSSTRATGSFLKKVGILSSENGVEIGPEAAVDTVVTAEEKKEKEGNPLLLASKSGDDAASSDAGGVVPGDSLDDIDAGASANNNKSADKASAPVSQDISPAVMFVGNVSSFLPSSEVSTNNQNQCDLWLLDPAVLTRAVLRWSSCIKGLSEEGRMGFADLVETLRSTSSDVMGRMNVDDFLWVMIQQWAKYTEYTLKKASSKVAWALKNSLEQKVPPELRLVKDHAGDETAALMTGTALAAMEEEQVAQLKLPSALKAKQAPRRVPKWTLIYVEQVAESIYKSSDGAIPRVPDLNKAAIAYLSTISTGTLRAHVANEMVKMFCDISAWDHNSGLNAGPPCDGVDRPPVPAGYSYNPASLFSIGAIECPTDQLNKIQVLYMMLSDYLPCLASFIKSREKFLKKKENKKFSGILKKRIHRCKELYKELHQVHEKKTIQLDNIETNFRAFLELLTEVDNALRLAVQVEDAEEFVSGQAEYPVDDTTHTAFVRTAYEEASEVYKISLRQMS